MKLRQILPVLALASASVASAATGYDLTQGCRLPASSGFSNLIWDAAESAWTMQISENNFGDIRPTIGFDTFPEDIDADFDVLSFEYKSPSPCGTVLLTIYNCGKKGTSTKQFSYTFTLPASSEWQPIRIDVKNARKHALTYFGRAGQNFEATFMDLVAGGTFCFRNARLESDEQSFNLITAYADKLNVIEAEDFNISMRGAGHVSRQKDRSQLTKYIDPYPGKFPIYAFTSASFETIGEVREWETLLQKKYKDLDEAGFNITEGTAFPGVDNAALWPGQSINAGEPIDLFEGTELKMMLRCGLDAGDERRNVIEKAKNSPRLAGYCVKDEPHCSDFNAMKLKLNGIRNLDDTHLLYGNLLHADTQPSAIGATSYDDYVERYINETDMGFLSYDFYAVRQIENVPESNESNTILMPNFFENLEIISKFAKDYNTKFWAFTRAMSSIWHNGVSSVSGVSNYKYPAPQEDHMRVQAFSALMYGAQGLQYWPYTACDQCNDAPIQRDGTKNPAWYYAKNINTDVQALTWVFLGAEKLRVAHTNAETPKGCIRLSKAHLPEGIENVTTDGKGMPVSVLQNGSNTFMMVLNPELWKNQGLTVKVGRNMKRVLMDGTTEAVTPGEYKHDLAPGRFVIYLTDENTPLLDTYVSVPGERSGYRIDAADVVISKDETASNGYYISDMGHTSWNIFSAINPDNDTRTISEEDAQAHWGSSFTYTLEADDYFLADINIGYSVPWTDYGHVAAYGAEPGISYTIDGKPSLNWPSQYAASMRLYVDGVPVMPSNQPSHPVAPKEFTADGAEFNRILADKESWESTDRENGCDVLYFWPEAGGIDSYATRYNEKPDYENVYFSKGTHKITVESLCYPWHFDNIRINALPNSGIADAAAEAEAPVEWFNLQGMRIDPKTAPHGIYVRRQGNKVQKLAL